MFISIVALGIVGVLVSLTIIDTVFLQLILSIGIFRLRCGVNNAQL